MQRRKEEKKTKTRETTDGAEGLQRKRGVARSLGKRLQTDSLLLLLRFIHTEGVRRPGTEDKLCVNHFFSSPLHSQLYGNKAQNRSGDLRLCISSGSRPSFWVFFFLTVGVQFPSPTQRETHFHSRLCECVRYVQVILHLIFAFAFVFCFFYYDHFLRTNSEGRAGVLRHIYEWTDHIQPDIHSSFSVDLNLQMYGYLKKKGEEENERDEKNKYLIFFLKKLPLCNTSLGAEINDEANEASLQLITICLLFAENVS